VRGTSVNAIAAEFTASEKILLAADHLDKQGRSPFTAETLIVTAWRQYPETFGLRGYIDQHPDSNKVLASLMGEKGLARRGWLVKMGKKEYALTREGRRILARLLQQEEPAPAKTIRLPRDKERLLVALLDSTALTKMEEGRKNELTSADAWRFWDITQNLRGEAVDEHLRRVEQLLQELEKDLAQTDVEMPGGRVVTAGDVRVLANVHRYMADRFAQHLNLLRNRPQKG
jgi:DNA-binding PadR family transcriptional regulator